jgi:nitrilase
MKVAVIQLNSGADKTANLEQVEQLVSQACMENQLDLVALPEMFTFMGGSVEQKKQAAETLPENGEAVRLLKHLAQRFQVVVHGGSLCELEKGHYYNSTCIIDKNGAFLTHYRKINLFNFTSVNNAQYYESQLFSPGKEVTTYVSSNHQIGCAICFDLRFGDLFQELIQRGVEIIVIPSAFTYETGQAHWEILCRSRAIETQSYLIAPAQTGQHVENGNPRSCWGHSMIVDPWGNIIAALDEEVGFITATLDFDYLAQVRKRLPLTKKHS